MEISLHTAVSCYYLCYQLGAGLPDEKCDPLISTWSRTAVAKNSDSNKLFDCSLELSDRKLGNNKKLWRSANATGKKTRGVKVPYPSMLIICSFFHFMIATTVLILRSGC